MGKGVNPAPAMGDWPSGRQLVARSIKRRHFGKWNIVYCDGHVQTHTTREIFNYNDDEVLKLRNKDNLPHREFFGNRAMKHIDSSGCAPFSIVTRTCRQYMWRCTCSGNHALNIRA